MSGGELPVSQGFVSHGEPQVIPATRMMNIEFPGVVKNHSKALTMLGGSEWVMKAFKGETTVTKLSFRPGSAKSHHTCGDMHRCTGLLIKMRYKRKSKKIETQLRGVIRRCMKFKGLSDFQYLPPEKLTTQAIKDFPALMTFVRKATEGKDAKDTQPLHITPLLFSKNDSPFDYGFKSNPYSRQAIINMPDGTVKHDRVLTRGSSSSVLVHRAWLDTTVPTDAPPKAIEILRKNATAMEVMPKIYELFKKRPVWSKTSLSLALSPVGRDLSHLLRVVLPPVCFTYASGPYRNLYIRYGYNVRSPPKEGETHPVCFELMDLRLGRLATKHNIERSSFTIESLDVAAPMRGTHISSQARPAWPTSSDPINWNRLPLSWTNLFKLMTIGGPLSATATKVPMKPRTLFIQYIDIQDPTLLMQIQKNSLKEARTKDKDTAWLLPSKTKALRAKLQAKYQLWLDTTDENAIDESAVPTGLPTFKNALPDHYGDEKAVDNTDDTDAPTAENPDSSAAEPLDQTPAPQEPFDQPFDSFAEAAPFENTYEEEEEEDDLGFG
eukprot:TRINITY_DN24845_c0_g1_i1.p1 TRINITY_DN24845_c0_g1~~TRINITY_DN24845_c0_g1_i1.p1  ORF type:complete len:571 (+),score=117.75 TRINITY_DN24845_c0_g1_i1:60-1715(+)